MVPELLISVFFHLSVGDFQTKPRSSGVEDIPSGWLLFSQQPGNIAVDYISLCVKKFMQK